MEHYQRNKEKEFIEVIIIILGETPSGRMKIR